MTTFTLDTSGPATLTHGDLCRLSVLFGRASDLRTDQDLRINEWLKGRIAEAGGSPVSALSTIQRAETGR